MPRACSFGAGYFLAAQRAAARGLEIPDCGREESQDEHVEKNHDRGDAGDGRHRAGRRRAYGAVSLDDGATWKLTNLSKDGDLSYIKIRVKPGKAGLVDYSGDVGRTFMASDGNKVLVTWVSKYCGGGSPAYSTTNTERAA